MDPTWHQRSFASADGHHALAWLVGIPIVIGFGLVLGWGEVYQRMHAMDATCSESWGRPDCQFALSSWTLLPWIAASMVGTGLATLEIVRASRNAGTPSVGWIGLAAGLSQIGSLSLFLFAPVWTSSVWAYGSYAILVASARRPSAARTGRRITPDILVVGLPLLLYVSVAAVLEAVA
jgi:hypothetical protein